MPQIGPVHDKDVPGLLEIYRSCLETPITFECQLPALKEPAGWIRRISGEYPLSGLPVGGGACRICLYKKEYCKMQDLRKRSSQKKLALQKIQSAQ